jgi:sulfhydrogenase subunit beta (sulfur reductase)
MKNAFISKLKPLLDAIAQEMTLYVPKKVDSHYVFGKYDAKASTDIDYNNIRACTSVKEFLFPLRELAAVMPDSFVPEKQPPFAVFGLKQCDMRSIEILDKVFLEDQFEDPLYVNRRENMLIISSDCFEPAESCFCNVLGLKPYVEEGFDLNISQVKDGFVIQAGSQKGRSFLTKHTEIFGEVPDSLFAEIEQDRAKTTEQLKQNNAEYDLSAPVNELLENGYENDVFDERAETCVECQACTRVCPTCHCFYLYDSNRGEYFTRMKMWDSCMRMAYAEVAGGANPRKVLGDRLRHRLMHKFSYFLDRYGINMCVGCGRCVDAEAGDVDIRVILKRLSDEFGQKGKGKKTAKAAK